VEGGREGKVRLLSSVRGVFPPGVDQRKGEERRGGEALPHFRFLGGERREGGLGKRALIDDLLPRPLVWRGKKKEGEEKKMRGREEGFPAFLVPFDLGKFGKGEEKKPKKKKKEEIALHVLPWSYRATRCREEGKNSEKKEGGGKERVHFL